MLRRNGSVIKFVVESVLRPEESLWWERAWSERERLWVARVVS